MPDRTVAALNAFMHMLRFDHGNPPHYFDHGLGDKPKECPLCRDWALGNAALDSLPQPTPSEPPTIHVIRDLDKPADVYYEVADLVNVLEHRPGDQLRREELRALMDRGVNVHQMYRRPTTTVLHP